jgi:hypothetical protein
MPFNKAIAVPTIIEANHVISIMIKAARIVTIKANTNSQQNALAQKRA